MAAARPAVADKAGLQLRAESSLRRCKDPHEGSRVPVLWDTGNVSTFCNFHRLRTCSKLSALLQPNEKVLGKEYRKEGATDLDVETIIANIWKESISKGLGTLAMIL